MDCSPQNTFIRAEAGVDRGNRIGGVADQGNSAIAGPVPDYSPAVACAIGASCRVFCLGMR